MPATPHPRRPAKVAVVASVLLALGLASAVPSLAYHLGLGTVHEEEVEQPGAFGASVDLAEPGTLEFSLYGYGEQLSTPVSHGIALYEDDGTYVGMIAVTAHFSPDRLYVHVSPTGTVTSAGDPANTSVVADGDLAALGGVDLVLEAPDGDQGTRTAGEEATIRAFTALHGREAGAHQAVVWIGETERTELAIETDASVDAIETTAGTAHVAGDQDLDEARLDAQARDSFVAGSLPLGGTNALGAKAMVDAREEIEVDQELRGFWGVAERKGSCSPDGCLGPSNASQACARLVSIPCGPTSLSWSNGTDGQTGQEIYSFTGAGPGSYTFSVDRKIDAYEADRFGVEWEENHSYLTVADVGLPDG